MKAENCGKTAKWSFYISGGILLLVGVYAFFDPMSMLAASAILWGVALLLMGVNELRTYFALRLTSLASPLWLCFGVLNIVTGMLFLLRIGAAMFAMTLLFGTWVLISGAIRLLAAFRLRASMPDWWVMALSGGLLVLLALLLIFNPFAAMLSVAVFIGIACMAAGILTIAEGRMLYGGR